jgi:hypothetical protein
LGLPFVVCDPTREERVAVMRNLTRSAILVVAFLALSSVAMAYDLQLIIDGSAIQPSKQVKVELDLSGGTNNMTFYCSFDGDGRMTGVTPVYSGMHYAYEFDASSGSSFFVRGINDALKEVKATTGYGATLSHAWSGSGRTTSGNIGIYRDHLSY